MYLPKNIYAAPIADQFIILDLGNDKYTCLSTGLSRVLAASLADDDASQFDAGTFEAARLKLIDRGFLSSSFGAPPQVAPPSPTASLWPSAESELLTIMAPFKMISAVRGLAATAVALKTLPLKLTIEWMRRAKARGRRCFAPVDRRDVLDVYAVARPWFPAKPICRLDALALSLFFWKNDVDVQIVFGVRLEPFMAHCWVQWGDMIINEPFDSILQYTPAMVI